MTLAAIASSLSLAACTGSGPIGDPAFDDPSATTGQAATTAVEGIWKVSCGFSKSLHDDPVLAPGKPGTSYLHDFFGNLSVTASSTYASMRAAGSTCATGDTAVYWVPSILRNGVKVNPVESVVYYESTGATDTIEAMPPDLRMVVGNPEATSAGQNNALNHRIQWGCSDNSQAELKAPPTSCSTGIITVHVFFPSCWDGVLTHADDSAHMAYQINGVCPAPFTHVVPLVITRLQYPVGVTTGTLTLGSGPLFTAHGGFWNTWNQTRLQQLVTTCLNKDTDCGHFMGTTPPGG
jgi:hypothetical protein